MKNFKNESLKLYLQISKQYPVLNVEEEKRLFMAYKNGDKKAEEIIFNSNLGLVAEFANYYIGKLPNRLSVSAEFDDFFQEGTIGLEKAMINFDIDKGYKFSTYAAPYIRGHIKTFINECCHVIKKPPNKMHDISIFFKRIKELEALYGRMLNRYDIAKEFNIDIKKVDELYNIYAQDKVESLEAEFLDGEGSALKDLIKDENNLEDEVMKKFMKDEIQKILSTDILTQREKEVISYRIGLDIESQMTLDEVAILYNVSRQRIQDIEKKALKKLYDSIEVRNLLPYILPDINIDKFFETSKGPISIKKVDSNGKKKIIKYH